ncbi:MAG: alpha/beta fold hydrolase [Flavobacterium sp.]
MKLLQSIKIPYFKTSQGLVFEHLSLWYEVFGKPLHTAPLVVVNHALTGNSTVTGEKGWWKELIGTGKTINTDHFTVIAFNIPGNGYDGTTTNFIHEYQRVTVRDIAQLFWLGLNELNIQQVHTIIGGSLGGAIAWEMAVLEPHRTEHLIPIATDWKATDWLIANVKIQELLLQDTTNPIEKARAHAMLLYRTPESLNQRFQRKKQEQEVFAIESWLDYHGNQLNNRFSLEAYRLMNHLLKTMDLIENRGTFSEVIQPVTATIHLVAVNTDYFFPATENIKTFASLQSLGIPSSYYEIQSIHGHDAFLIEFEQLSAFLNPIFNTTKTQHYVTL